MTVAALLCTDGFPIAITDHLISSQIPPDASVNTVLTDNETRVSDQGDIPVGMAAKVWHVSDEMYMVYAGRVSHALEILEKVKARTVYAPYSEKIHAEILTWADVMSLEASFILVYRGEDGYIHHMSRRARSYQSPLFGDVLIIGSGEGALTKSIEEVTKHVQPLPDRALQPTFGSLQLDIAHAIALQARASVEYMGTKSEFASQATGGLFALSYLPRCYGWSEDTPPPGFVQNRVCELFTERRGSQVYLNRVVISSRAIDEEPLNVLVYRNSTQRALRLSDLTVSLPQSDWETHRIAQRRADTVVSPFAGLEGNQNIHAVIVYAQFKDKAELGTGRVHEVFLQSGAPIVSLSANGANLELEFSSHMLRKVWEKTTGWWLDAQPL